jgi:nitroimidazol reductase NimA-like FMN-containing flavoprotein (pyridoxamine 5'-phosphate oxidase superfamily)
MLEKIKALVQKNDICVLATVSNGVPHCSLMSYVPDEVTLEIYMLTLRQTKKYRNLLENPAVSILIDTRVGASLTPQETMALTINGTFQKIPENDRHEKALKHLLKRHPHLETFAQDPDAELIAVRIRSFQLLEGLTASYFIAVD